MPLNRPSFNRLNEWTAILQGSSGLEFPDLDFVYADADSHANEIAELYSYTEQVEFQYNVRVS